MVSKPLNDVFVDGLRKGWHMGTINLLPNVMMAFVLIHALKAVGLLEVIGNLCGPIMAVFGLPGEAITVLLTAWLSAGGGVGVAASLFTQGTLTAVDLSILAPGIFLMGAQLQYMGRILAVAGVDSRHYKVLFCISIFNALCAMLTMRYIVI